MAENQTKINISEETVQRLEAETTEAVKFNEVEYARNFIRRTWKQLREDKDWQRADLNLRQRFERLYYLNSILFIPALGEQELLALCQNGIGWYFKEMMDNHDLAEKIKAHLVAVYQADRDSVKEKIRKALLENDEIITAGRIERNDKRHRASIKEWLIDYTSVVGTGKADSLRFNEYFTSNKNFVKLAVGDKQKVRSLIELYEKLKLSSMEPEGMEETIDLVVDGKWFVFDHGRFEEIGLVGSPYQGQTPSILPVEPSKFLPDESEPSVALPKTTPVASGVEQEVLLAYQGDLDQQRLINKEIEKLNKKFGNNPAVLRSEFFKAVQKKDVVKTISLLRVLAQLGDLENFLAMDEKLNKFLKVVWAKQFGPELAAKFENHPAQVEFVRLFLRYVLEQRLNMSEAQAARIGQQIGNIFVSLGKKSYNKMAYFDVKAKEFKWFE
ncbi:MAG: hypothetical protein RB292_00010 [Patescibacteria group bacterium]|jgi:hypothetical protein|nr:hypothetical protein [Patescibacteria group bacterium]